LVALTSCACAGLSLAADTGGAAAPAKAPIAAAKPARPAPIDINSASKAQLKTLPGIGDAEAGRIIAGRPYLSKADLASKDALALGIYLQIKDRIIAVQKQKPKAGK
jgi:DNA uptake protein ComE-like DNA-binding protein